MDDFDYSNWDPLSIQEVEDLLSGLDIFWCFAGGYAIELFVGKSFRDHGDIDILIKREDQLQLQEHLWNWELYWGTRPGLKRWEKGEFIQKGYQDIWARQNAEAPWVFQVMLFDVEDGDWLFKRDESIRLPLKSIYHTTTNGLNFLAPEIQLLYKARAELRPKDQEDFAACLPLLSTSVKTWLLECLNRRFPKGHQWIELLTG